MTDEARIGLLQDDDDSAADAQDSSARPGKAKIPLWIPYLLAFFAGFQILVVELVASRYINLYLGPSIYGWTSLIGVVLGGVSIGNTIGGHLAGKPDIRRNLGLACIMSALTTLVVMRLNPILTYAVTEFATIPWAPRVFLAVMALLFVPSIAMGLISPMAAKWGLTLRPDRPGEVLGTMGALGTWGAIMGTFLTGFFLIGMMGTGSLMLTMMSIMGLLGIWLLGAHTLRLGRVPIGAVPFVLIIAGMIWSWPIGSQAEAVRAANIRLADPEKKGEVLYFDESNYFTIKVQTDNPDAPQRTLQLVLDYLVHGFVVEGQPDHLEYSYEHVYSWVTHRWAKAQGSPEVAPRALYIGGGSYTFPRWMETRYPGAKQLVAEIDPRVLEAVHAQMGLPRDTPIVTRADDARRVVETEASGEWDLIFGDAFNSFSVPYHLTSVEFMEDVKRLLAPGGVYAMNIIDLYDAADPAAGKFVSSMVRTLDEVFGEEHVSVWVEPNVSMEGTTKARSTYVLVATTGPLDLGQLGNPDRDPPPSATSPSPWLPRIVGEELAAMRAAGMVLTDDFCPVDQLLAPVAATRSEAELHAAKRQTQQVDAE